MPLTNADRCTTASAHHCSAMRKRFLCSISSAHPFACGLPQASSQCARDAAPQSSAARSAAYSSPNTATSVIAVLFQLLLRRRSLPQNYSSLFIFTNSSPCLLIPPLNIVSRIVRKSKPIHSSSPPGQPPLLRHCVFIVQCTTVLYFRHLSHCRSHSESKSSTAGCITSIFFVFATAGCSSSP